VKTMRHMIKDGKENARNINAFASKLGLQRKMHQEYRIEKVTENVPTAVPALNGI
jgi:hypothetical protein